MFLRALEGAGTTPRQHAPPYTWRVLINEPRDEGYVELAREVLGPHRRFRLNVDNFPEHPHSRQVVDAALGYRLASQVGEHDRAALELERLRGLVR